MPRYFTLEQANEALKIIQPAMAQIMEIRQDILSKQPETWPVLEKAAGNGGSKVTSELANQFERLEKLVHQIQNTGAILKEINSGLVDFLAKREGRDVYLCWQYGEDGVSYWHDIEAGFAGRQPL
ncbi:MAG: DUF2203 domain-containing protein [Omnitrophica WOR_2 bacterium]